MFALIQLTILSLQAFVWMALKIKLLILIDRGFYYCYFKNISSIIIFTANALLDILIATLLDHVHDRDPVPLLPTARLYVN